MDAKMLGQLRVRSVVKSRGNDSGKAPLTCVLLHGFGAPGDDLVGLVDGLDAPAGTRFVFPEALHSMAEFAPPHLANHPGLTSSRAWWMIDVAAMERAMARGEIRDLTRDVPEGLAEARAALVSMLDALAQEDAQVGRRLVLGGFSQGAMLALDTVLREPERSVAGVIVLSGTLLAESEWTARMSARKGLPVFQSHGQSDPILPFSIAERLRDALSTHGLDVTFDPFAGPHTIPPRTLARLGQWLHALP